ncbi:MAG TPA: kelch repeat-containing protein [Vicinamibacterales bacterium]|nr:kelch repeat-containing protein [Vicinamibacterales bacterium]
MAGAWTSQSPMPGGVRTQLAAVGFPGPTSAALAGTLPPGSLLSIAGIYAFGGSLLTSTYFPRAERFDIVANAWTTLPDMPKARVLPAVAAAHKWIYVIGGYGGTGASTSVDRFDPTTGTWVTSKTLTFPGLGLWSLGAAVVVVNGHLRLYVMGGNSNSIATQVRWCEITANGETGWNTGPSLNYARHSFGVAVVDNTIYCIGGMSDFSQETSIEVLKPGANKWTLHLNALTTSRSAFGCAYSGGRIFLIGGDGPEHAMQTVEAIDPVTLKPSGAWAPMPSLRSQFGTASIPVFIMSPKDTIPIFVAGGDSNKTPIGTVDRFDP